MEQSRQVTQELARYMYGTAYSLLMKHGSQYGSAPNQRHEACQIDCFRKAETQMYIAVGLRGTILLFALIPFLIRRA